MRFLRRRYSRSRRMRTAGLLCTVAILAIVAYAFKTNYTPGPVSAASPRGEPLEGYRSHAEFEKECKLCHAPVHCLVAGRCEVCHQDVAEERARAMGLHGRLPATERCQTCHGEHQGRNKLANKLASLNFDHEMLTGFSLIYHETDYEGQAITCDGCHLDERYRPEEVDCVTCHTSAAATSVADHTETFGVTCSTCHDGRGRMATFDHDQVFPREGAHSEAECPDCHASHFLAGSLRGCVLCHPDPELHAGQFGLECDLCHSAVAWTPAELTRHPFNLDHGSEEEVSCETCHLDTYVEHTCFGCHDHQPEQIRASHVELDIPNLDDCGGCHPTGLPGDAVQIGSAATVVQVSTGGGSGE